MTQKPYSTPGTAEPASTLCLRGYPDPSLRLVSKPVPQGEIASRLPSVLAAMVKLMYAAEGVGLAAPQVGYSERFFVMDASPEHDSPLAMVNPEILERRGQDSAEEGCLCIPGVRGKVKRSAWIRVRYFDENGAAHESEMDDLAARVFQHETDHLDGVLFIDRLSTVKRLSIRKALRELEAKWTAAKPGT
jgi:peptide deformylase